ncbi:hypothetical protein [Nocardia sp. NPDC003963]
MTGANPCFRELRGDRVWRRMDQDPSAYRLPGGEEIGDDGAVLHDETGGAVRGAAGRLDCY